jgi:hypothetical protein
MHNHILPADGLSGLPEAVLFGVGSDGLPFEDALQAGRIGLW